MHRNCPMYLWMLEFALLFMPPAFAHEQHAHVHGVAKLNIAVEGKNLTLSLESPMENLLGFEHPPRKPEEKVALANLKQQLLQPSQLFALPAKAVCKSIAVHLDSPLWSTPAAQKSLSHADLDAEFTYECTQPQSLTNLTVQIFERFPRLQRMDVQIITISVQHMMQLTPKKNQIKW